MDNILKIVLGVVAFVGLIVLLIPEGNPLQDKGPNAATAREEGKNLPPPANPDDDEEEDGETRTPGDAPAPAPVRPTSNETIAFGQPMLDPTPPGMQNQQQQQQPQNQGQNYETPEDDDRNTSGPAYPGIPNYGPQPAYQYNPPLQAPPGN